MKARLINSFCVVAAVLAMATVSSIAGAQRFGRFGGEGFDGGSRMSRSPLSSTSMGQVPRFRSQMIQSHSFQPQFNQYGATSLRDASTMLTRPNFDVGKPYTPPSRRGRRIRPNGSHTSFRSLNLSRANTNLNGFKNLKTLQPRTDIQSRRRIKPDLIAGGVKNLGGPKFAEMHSKLGIGPKHIGLHAGQKFDLGKHKHGPGFTKGFCGIGGCFPKCLPHCWPYPVGNYCWPYPTWCTTNYYCPGVIVSYPEVYVPAPVVTETAVNAAPLSDRDVQMVDILLVDPGDPAARRGPRYRIIVGNKGTLPAEAFEVAMVIALDNAQPLIVPQQIEGMDANSIRPVDIELPAEAMSLRLANGQPAADMLIVVIDGRQAVSETDENNNAIKLARSEIKGVAMQIQPPAEPELPVGTDLTVTGTGLGPDMGKAVIAVDGMAFEAPISTWTATNAKIQLPRMLLSEPVAAQLTLVRPDGVSAEPIPVTLVPPAKN